jgi:hypothetical protein
MNNLSKKPAVAGQETAELAARPLLGYVEIETPPEDVLTRGIRLIAGIRRRSNSSLPSSLTGDLTFRAVVLEGGTRRKPQAKNINLRKNDESSEARFVLRPSASQRYTVEIDFFLKRHLVLRLPVSFSD